MKRPLFFACLFFMAVVAAAHCLGLPLTGRVPDPGAEQLVSDALPVTVRGRVSSCEMRPEYCILMLRDAVAVGEGDALYGQRPYYHLYTVRVSLSLETLEGSAVSATAGAQATDAAPGKTVPSAAGAGYPIGTELTLTGILGHASPATNPGQFDAAAYDRTQGISFRLYRAKVISVSGKPSVVPNAVNRLRKRLLARLQAVYPEDVQGVLAAMLLGRKDRLAEEDRDRYEAGGVSHMLVISSLHLSILGMLLLWIFRRMRIPPRTAEFLAGAILFFFIALTGFSTSALRAFLLYFFGALSRRLGRTYDPWTALAFSAAVLVLANPYYLFYSAFQLSFIAASLCILSRGQGKLTMGIILHFGLAPLIAWYFFKLPLFGIAANLLLVPFLPVILVAGSFGLLFGGLAVKPAVWLVRLYSRILEWTRRTPELSFFGRSVMPEGGVWMTGRPSVLHLLAYFVLFGLFLFLLHLFRNRKRKLAAFLLLPFMLLLLAPRPVRGAQFTFLDTGQGDMICVQAEGGFTMLVDAGSSSVLETGKYRLVPYLEYSGISHINCIVATHMDEDHINGLEELFSMIINGQTTIRADYLFVPSLPYESENFTHFVRTAQAAGLKTVRVSCGDRFRCGDLVMEVLSPRRQESIPTDTKTSQRSTDAVRKSAAVGGEDTYAVQTEDIWRTDNEQCVVLLVSYGNFDALLAADIEGVGEEELVSYLAERKSRSFNRFSSDKRTSSDSRILSDNRASSDQRESSEGLSIELLKVAHHGSRNSTSEEFLRVVSPQVAIISCGKNNFYGHPHEELLERLRACGAEIRRTDLEGAITVTTDGTRFLVYASLDDS